MHDMANSGRPAAVFHYQIAGRLFAVEFPDPYTIYPVDRYLSVMRASRVQSAGGVPGAKLILQRGNLERSNLPSCFVFDEAGAEASFCSSRNSYEVRIQNSTVRAGHDRTVVVSMAEELDRRSFLFERLFAHGLAAALRRAGAFELHCAAVIDPKTSRSALIVGPSGSGKSTLALQLAANGWNFSSDDLVLLTASGEKIKAFGLRKHFALTSETIAKSGVPGLPFALEGRTIGADNKLPLLPENIFPSQYLHSCVPEILIFAHRRDAYESQLAPMTQAEAMKRLLEISQASCLDQPMATGLLAILGRLARQCRAFDLLSGTDLLGNLQYTAGFLGSIFSRKAA